jgi:hypothetical protein
MKDSLVESNVAVIESVNDPDDDTVKAIQDNRMPSESMRCSNAPYCLFCNL